MNFLRVFLGLILALLAVAALLELFFAFLVGYANLPSGLLLALPVRAVGRVLGVHGDVSARGPGHVLRSGAGPR